MKTETILEKIKKDRYYLNAYTRALASHGLESCLWDSLADQRQYLRSRLNQTIAILRKDLLIARECFSEEKDTETCAYIDTQIRMLQNYAR